RVSSKFEPETLNFDSASNFGLSVSDLRKSFRDPSGGALEVLRSVSFGVRAGEMTAVVGASGAGKTTLLHVVGGLEAADAGSARLGDFDVTRADAAALARWRGREVGFVFQFHHLLADLSAEENVAMPLLVARRGRRESRASALALLDAVGLSARASHNVGELSGGEQQRVAIARSLVTRPRLVLADEPTGNLDARTGRAILDVLLQLNTQRGLTVIMVTHNAFAATYGQRTLELRDDLIVRDVHADSEPSRKGPVPLHR